VFENPVRNLVHERLVGSLDDLVILFRAVLHTGEARYGLGLIHEHSLSFQRSRPDRGTASALDRILGDAAPPTARCPVRVRQSDIIYLKFFLQVRDFKPPSGIQSVENQPFAKPTDPVRYPARLRMRRAYGQRTTSASRTRLENRHRTERFGWHTPE
jgi:hypothetical protein